MFSHKSAMVTTLTALRSRLSEAADERLDLEKRVATLRTEGDDLEAAINALQRLVGEEHTAGDLPETSDEAVVAPSQSQTKSDSLVSQPVHNEETSRDEAPPRHKRVRSTQMVKDHLQFVAQPQTREEILAYFQERGVAANWRNPVNAVNTAVFRALESGEIRELADGRVVHASAPTTDSPSSPVSGAPSLTEGQ